MVGVVDRWISLRFSSRSRAIKCREGWGSNLREVAGQGNFVASDKVPTSVDSSLMPQDRICHGSEDPRLWLRQTKTRGEVGWEGGGWRFEATSPSHKPTPTLPCRSEASPHQDTNPPHSTLPGQHNQPSHGHSPKEMRFWKKVFKSEETDKTARLWGGNLWGGFTCHRKRRLHLWAVVRAHLWPHFINWDSELDCRVRRVSERNLNLIYLTSIGSHGIFYEQGSSMNRTMLQKVNLGFYGRIIRGTVSTAIWKF